MKKDLELFKQKLEAALALPDSDPNKAELVSMWKFEYLFALFAERKNTVILG